MTIFFLILQINEMYLRDLATSSANVSSLHRARHSSLSANEHQGPPQPSVFDWSLPPTTSTSANEKSGGTPPRRSSGGHNNNLHSLRNLGLTSPGIDPPALPRSGNSNQWQQTPPMPAPAMRENRHSAPGFSSGLPGPNFSFGAGGAGTSTNKSPPPGRVGG